MPRYHPVSMALHWLTVVGLSVATAMALYMVDIPGITPAKLRLFNYHKWLGVCLWGVVLIRLMWRWSVPPPALPPSVSPLQARLAGVGHAGLYGLMLLIPLLGYFYSLAAGYPVVLFGTVPLPVLIAPDPELKVMLKAAHAWANRLMWLVVAGHVLAALKHVWIDRDGVMQRMWPGRGPLNEKV